MDKVNEQVENIAEQGKEQVKHVTAMCRPVAKPEPKAEENLKTKGTELEPELPGLLSRYYLQLPEESTGYTRYVRDFFTCLEFLTRIRFTKRASWFPDEFARSVPFFPIIGLIIGLLMLVAVFVAFFAGFKGVLLGAFLIGAELVYIGTLMYDGFMDTCDGIFSARTRQRMLEIMQDSHVGANAVIGVVLVVLFKAGLYSELPVYYLGKVIVAMYVFTRTLMVVYISYFPNARPGGLGAMFVNENTKTYSLIALGLGAVIIGATGLAYLQAAALAVLPCLAVAYGLKNTLGGLTGDTFGFLTLVGEIIFLLCAYAIV